MDTCEVCGKQQPACWPVMVNQKTQEIRNLCNGCAALDSGAAEVLDWLERQER